MPTTRPLSIVNSIGSWPASTAPRMAAASVLIVRNLFSTALVVQTPPKHLEISEISTEVRFVLWIWELYEKKNCAGAMICAGKVTSVLRSTKGTPASAASFILLPSGLTTWLIRHEIAGTVLGGPKIRVIS